MLLVEPGRVAHKHLEAALEFVRLLRAEGHPACVSSESAAGPLPRTLRYEAIGDTRDLNDISPDHVIILNCQGIDGTALERLRRIYSNSSPRLTAIGCFKDLQNRNGTQSKIAYTTGTEPGLIELSSIRKKPLVESESYLLFGQPNPEINQDDEHRHVTFFLSDDCIEARLNLEALSLIIHAPEASVTLIVSAQYRAQIQGHFGQRIKVYSYSEVQPEVLARQSGIIIFLGKGSPGDRAASSAVHSLINGGIVIDATESASMATSGAPVVRGPTSLMGVVALIKENIWPQVHQFRQTLEDSSWIKQNRLETLTHAIGLQRNGAPGHAPRAGKGREQSKIVFVPTNGVGLGHAQRTSLIATELASESRIQFAAFAGCAPMLRNKGFDVVPLVSKSSAHTDSYSNDLMNYLRLHGMLQKHDKIVFDGAYIFDSIMRNIREFRLDATWIRRGLWQPGQIDRMPLEREHEFSRVIVPCEAFEELNARYTFGAHVRDIGPILQLDPLTLEARKRIRSNISARVDREFSKVLVTMLGGGVAADRSAQIQTLCALAETREDWVHLMVVWPHATILPSLESWNNSHVVRTKNALRLAQAADLTISAAGYNSFHELLYHRVPSIFIPQMAGYMDDQERRARAASDRGLAITVQPGDVLTIRREVSRLLEHGTTSELIRSMESISLPELGNEVAARIVEGSYET